MSAPQLRLLFQSSGLSKQQMAEHFGCDVSTIYRWLRGDNNPNKAVVDLLEAMARRRAGHGSRPGRAFTFIDLFAGIGGMRIGLEKAGGECVFTSEWNQHSRQTYAANFADGPDHPFEADITKVDVNKIPQHDLLVGGFPCQPFSIAGVSKKNSLGKAHGFQCKEQGNLFFDIVRILQHHRPAGFLLENVKNLKSHDGGQTFAVIRHYLEDRLGYQIHVRVINAKGLVPQNRERVFIVGFRSPVEFDFDDVSIPDPKKGPKLATILHSEDGTEENESPYTVGAKAAVADKYVLSEHLWTYLQNYQKKHQALGHGFGFGLVGPDDSARTLSARYFKDGSEILISRGPRARPRRLTPRECARLMGFDREFGRPFKIPVSDTQAYRQFGNAVVVPVVSRVAKAIAPFVIAVRDLSENSKSPVAS